MVTKGYQEGVYERVTVEPAQKSIDRLGVVRLGSCNGREKKKQEYEQKRLGQLTHHLPNHNAHCSNPPVRQLGNEVITHVAGLKYGIVTIGISRVG